MSLFNEVLRDLERREQGAGGGGAPMLVGGGSGAWRRFGWAAALGAVVGLGVYAVRPGTEHGAPLPSAQESTASTSGFPPAPPVGAGDSAPQVEPAQLDWIRAEPAEDGLRLRFGLNRETAHRVRPDGASGFKLTLADTQPAAGLTPVELGDTQLRLMDRRVEGPDLVFELQFAGELRVQSGMVVQSESAELILDVALVQPRPDPVPAAIINFLEDLTLPISVSS